MQDSIRSCHDIASAGAKGYLVLSNLDVTGSPHMHVKVLEALVQGVLSKCEAA